MSFEVTMIQLEETIRICIRFRIRIGIEIEDDGGNNFNRMALL